MNKILLNLRKLWKTVLTSEDLAFAFGKEYTDIRRQIAYYCNRGYLRRLHNGVFAIGDEPYDILELANKILRPSYISLDTVLRMEGVIFQYAEEITLVSYKTITMDIDGHTLAFRSIKKPVLLNGEWIIHSGNISIATKERAFLDAMYLYKDSYFDNVGSIDWKKCFELVKMYQSPALEKRLIAYKQKYA